MSLTLKNAAAVDTTFVVTGFTGLDQSFANAANTATNKTTGFTKHTLPQKGDSRHLLSFTTKVFDSATGKWGKLTTNFTMVQDDSGLITSVHKANHFAFISNYFTRLTAAMPSNVSDECIRFVEGISPF